MTHSISATSLFVRESDAYRPATDSEIIDAARGALKRKCRRGRKVNSPGAMRDYLSLLFAKLEHEVFILILLDTHHRILGIEEMFRGTIDSASVYPREVVKAALKANASSVICAHNHPSGIAEPSQADDLITRRLKDALGLVEIRLLDHLVVGHGTVTSFSERGML